MELLSKFIDFMHAHGCGPESASDVIADGKRRDFRLAGDKPGQKKGRYRLTLLDGGDRAIGWVINYREGVPHSWHSGASRTWTPEEKKAWKVEAEARKEADRLEREAEHEAHAADSQALWDAATPLTDGQTTHPYLMRKKVRAHGLRVGTDVYGRHDCLLIPMRDREGKIWNLQSIAPDGEKMNGRGRAHGLYHAIGEIKSPAIVCEGYATGASIYAALAVGTLVAFSAGNLEPVAALWPEHRLIFCADNDQWVIKSPRPAELKGVDKDTVPGADPRWQEWREKGWLHNPGVAAAESCARRFNGHVVWPDFAPNDKLKPTDFNDLRVGKGIAAVALAIAPVLEQARNAAVTNSSPSRVQRSGSVSGDDPQPPLAPGDAPFYDEMDGLVRDDNDIEGDGGMPFYTLGFDNGLYYYYPFKTMQIVALSPGAHSINNLMQLANLGDWQNNPLFLKCRPNEIAMYAANWLMNRAHSVGVFKPGSRIRGRGVWIDDGRIVYHAGHCLYVDGVKTSIVAFKSYYVYVQGEAMREPGLDCLSNAESYKLRQICEGFTWANPLSGKLLAGFIAIAPFCAMLPKRPHVWITGESGSGKTTCKMLVSDILEGVSFNYMGGTTEAKIREEVRYDALPILYDEAEAENQSQRVVMENVLNLCRRAFDGGMVGKFGQAVFNARFMMALFSINPSVKAFADQRRISMLVLKKNRKASAQEDYKNLCRLIAETVSPEWRMRLMNRGVQCLPVILQNVKTFNQAARRVLGDAAVADQIAPILAGLYFLSSTEEISHEKAEEWIRQHEWDEHSTISETPDCERLLESITTSTVSYEPSSGTRRDVTIGEMIIAAAGRDKDGVLSKESADKKLRQFGIKVTNASVSIANCNKNLGRLLKDTEWSKGTSGWADRLCDFTDAKKSKHPIQFSPGTSKQRYTELPLSKFLNEESPPVQAAFDMDEEIVF